MVSELLRRVRDALCHHPALGVFVTRRPGAAAFGATAAIPVTASPSKLARKQPVLTSRPVRDPPKLRHPDHLISIAPILRLGSDRLYGFGGFGIAGAVTGRYGGGFLQGRGGVVAASPGISSSGETSRSGNFTAALGPPALASVTGSDETPRGSLGQ